MFDQTDGVTRTKPSPIGFSYNYENLVPAIEWVSRHLRTLGYVSAQAEFDPYLSLWVFRDDHGEFIIKLPHDLIERIVEAVFAHDRMVDQNQKALVGRFGLFSR